MHRAESRHIGEGGHRQRQSDGDRPARRTPAVARGRGERRRIDRSDAEGCPHEWREGRQRHRRIGQRQEGRPAPARPHGEPVGDEERDGQRGERLPEHRAEVLVEPAGEEHGSATDERREVRESVPAEERVRGERGAGEEKQRVDAGEERGVAEQHGEEVGREEEGPGEVSRGGRSGADVGVPPGSFAGAYRVTEILAGGLPLPRRGTGVVEVRHAQEVALRPGRLRYGIRAIALGRDPRLRRVGEVGVEERAAREDDVGVTRHDEQQQHDGCRQHVATAERGLRLGSRLGVTHRRLRRRS